MQLMPDDAERDFCGYGATPPDPRWPGGARVAININLNYEAGGEHSLLEGDSASEGMLNDIGFPSYPGVRSPMVESAFEYGSRCGVWRLLRIFARFGVPVSVLAVVRALERNPEVAHAMIAAGHEIVSHGYRWIDYHGVPEAIEREHIAKAVVWLTQLTGSRPLGWMTGRPGPNTRRLLAEHGGFLYDRDSLGDELPYWVAVGGQPYLVVPYSFEMNDNRFNENHGFSKADDFFAYLKDGFDLLYEEGADQAKLMSIAIHDRLIGRPARAVGLIRFLDYVKGFEKVWFCRGIDVARHWRQHFPPAQGAVATAALRG
jgi:putative urate catabolism protein